MHSWAHSKIMFFLFGKLMGLAMRNPWKTLLTSLRLKV